MIQTRSISSWYLRPIFALAVFIPASGWAADRFGARRIFRLAMVVFAIGSIACATSNSLATLVVARILQGIGGAMMVPVGRLIVLRAHPNRVSSMGLHGSRFLPLSAPFWVHRSADS
ncbi:MAG: MFS transporter [Nitratireductor sp.]